MENQPQIRIRQTPGDTTLNWLAWLAFAGLWGIVLWTYNDLPDRIPAHYNSLGQVDRYDSRYTVYIQLVITTLLFGGISLLEKYPHVLNYPAPITNETADRQYRMAIRLLRLAKLGICVLFAFIYYRTYRVALGEAEGLGHWFLPVCITTCSLLVVVYLYYSLRAR